MVDKDLATKPEQQVAHNPGGAEHSAGRAAELWKPGSSGPGPVSGDHLADLHKQSANELTALGFPKTDIADPKNPAPETWKYDPQGHLLSAGDRVKADYDAQGNLTKAKIDGNTYEKKGNDVVETYKGNDGKDHTYTMHDVTNFSLKTEKGNNGGEFDSVNLESKTANGSGMGEGAVIYTSPEKEASDRKQAENEAAEKIHNPEPSTWKYDDKGHLLSAGDQVKASYDDKGNLTEATIGDKNYKRVGKDVVETYTGNDGKQHTYTAKDVTKFSLNGIDGDYKGKFKSVELEAKSDNGSGMSEGKVIYTSEEYQINQILDARKAEEEAAKRRLAPNDQ